MKKLMFFSMICTILACSKTDNENISFLECNELSDTYKIYDGETIKCKFYYTLTEYNGQNFIQLNSYCADLARNIVFNENCEDICADDPYNENSPCGKYLRGKEIIEILLIEK